MHSILYGRLSNQDAVSSDRERLGPDAGDRVSTEVVGYQPSKLVKKG